jgi:hypothetical protein
VIAFAVVLGVSANGLVTRTSAQQETPRPADPVTVSADGVASVQAPATTLGLLLRALRAASPMELRIDPAVADRPVSLTLTGVPVVVAVVEALKAAGVDYVVSEAPGGQGRVFRVVAGNLRDAVLIADGQPERRDARPALDSPPPPAVTLRESEDDSRRNRGMSASATDDPGAARGEGEVSGEEFLEAISNHGQPRPTGWVELPFPDETGQPIRVYRDPAPRTFVELPFPGEDGQPLVLPMPAGPQGLSYESLLGGPPPAPPPSDGTPRRRPH